MQNKSETHLDVMHRCIYQLLKTKGIRTSLLLVPGVRYRTCKELARALLIFYVSTDADLGLRYSEDASNGCPRFHASCTLAVQTLEGSRNH